MTSGTPTRMAAWLESAWLARYLERQLEGEELAWFEAYLLDKPELLGMVEADNALRKALSAEEIDPRVLTVRGETSTEMRSQRGTTRRPEGFHWFAVAALIVGIGFGWTVHREPSGLGVGIIPSPSRIVLDTMRGAEVERVEDHEESEYALVEIFLPEGATEISLSIGGETIALSASKDGFVSYFAKKESIAGSAVIRYRLADLQLTRAVDLKRLAQEKQQ